jgi:hypothetical protein
MGLISKLIGGAPAATALGTAAANLAEVFVPNATKKLEADLSAYTAAVNAGAAEFQNVRPGLFDTVVNGINRLPRPFLALGTLGLFTYAMIDPVHFAGRMQGLATVPEPLWWLLTAIVSFYFGAREAHYFRTRPGAVLSELATNVTAPKPPGDGVVTAGDNPALRDWRAAQT